MREMKGKGAGVRLPLSRSLQKVESLPIWELPKARTDGIRSRPLIITSGSSSVLKQPEFNRPPHPPQSSARYERKLGHHHRRNGALAWETRVRTAYIIIPMEYTPPQPVLSVGSVLRGFCTVLDTISSNEQVQMIHSAMGSTTRQQCHWWR